MPKSPLTFRDAANTILQPVKHFDHTAQRSTYRVRRVPGLHFSQEQLIDSDDDIARAMLIDRLPGRTKPVSGGQVTYSSYGDALISYELAPEIARRLNLPETGSVGSSHSSGAALEALRRKFIERYPDFESAGAFQATTGLYHETYRKRVDALLDQVSRHLDDPAAVLDDVLGASRQQSRGARPPFFDGDVVWRTPQARNLDPTRFDAAVAALLRGADDPAQAIEAFNAIYWDFLKQSAEGKPRRDTRVVPSTLLAAVAPERAISVRYQYYSNASKLINDRFLFKDKPMSADEYGRVLALANQLRSAIEDWGWHPRDLWDVHGFILATCADRDGEPRHDAILAHFDIDAGFKAARSDWSQKDTDAFVAFAQAIHDVGLDWYFVNIPPYQLRFGFKRPGRDADFVLAMIGGSPPRMELRNRAPQALKANGAGYLPIDGDLLDWVEEHHELLASHSDPDRDQGYWPDELVVGQADSEPETSSIATVNPIMNTTNLILYGPPGTGKTFATAREAVRLCGEEPPSDRDELMSRYRALSEAGRIEFVTFHQSMAYEEFVEGLRPSSVDEEGQPVVGGFRLMPTPGIFRRIARRAETSTGSGAAKFAVGNRQVFKMSVGDASNPDDAHLFEEAIRGGYVILGFDDIDWSDQRYARRDAIMAAAQERAEAGKDLNAQSAALQMPHIFRNWMKQGDLVIVSKGTKLFRAIGIITGDYRYAPRESGDYGHQRDVTWLWVDRDGVPVEEIYARGFSMRTTYQMLNSDLNLPALERYANSQQDGTPGAAEPFVLIIDEINRANISKVFGELITLLEPDKRLGRTNALEIRLPYSREMFGVPANLHIVGTMNTADRSIALIDKALRRRFTFKEMMPDYNVDGMDVIIPEIEVTLAEILRTLNDRIEYLLDREHQIGHGWLLDCKSKPQLDVTMRDKVIPLIAEYFFEDWGRVADVLGGRTNNPFLEDIKLSPPPGVAAEQPRYRWLPRESFAADAYQRLVRGN